GAGKRQRREAGQGGGDRKAPGKDKAGPRRDRREGEDERESRVADGAIRVEPDPRRGAEHARGERAGAREPPVEAVLEGREGAEPAVKEALHGVAGARTATGLS